MEACLVGKLAAESFAQGRTAGSSESTSEGTASSSCSSAAERCVGTGATESSASCAAKYVLDDFIPVGSFIGTGSFGTVQRVVHRRTAEVFAMKVIPKAKVLEHKMIDYLARELKTQFRIKHPNILRLHYYFEDAQQVHVLLEYASGGTLFALMRKTGRLAEPDSARFFANIAGALNHLHSHGVIHRDVKPENILLCAGGVAKLADFGWCAEVLEGKQRNTFCGTFDYLSPEMALSEPHDASVDVWAMGILLYEMLMGKPPFAARSQAACLSRIVHVDLQIPDEIPSLAADLIRRILVREPSARLGLGPAMRHPWVQQHTPSPAETAEKFSVAESKSPRQAHRMDRSKTPPMCIKNDEMDNVSRPSPRRAAVSKDSEVSGNATSAIPSLATPPLATVSAGPALDFPAIKSGANQFALETQTATSKASPCQLDGLNRSAGPALDLQATKSEAKQFTPEAQMATSQVGQRDLDGLSRTYAGPSCFGERQPAGGPPYGSADGMATTGFLPLKVSKPWNHTGTYEKVRNFVRKSSHGALQRELSQDLDRTIVHPQAAHTNYYGCSGGRPPPRTGNAPMPKSSAAYRGQNSRPPAPSRQQASGPSGRDTDDVISPIRC